MSSSKIFALAALSAALMATPALAPAQISIGIGGPAPVCPYGYFDYAPYDCAPYGYYGPDWFNGGIFLGAGPWFHGGHGFYGHVDNRYDPHHGYRGPLPGRGVQPFNHFQGNEARDGQGHIGNAGHAPGGEHSAGFSGGGHPGEGGGGFHGGGGGHH
jgi:hypothetical protein